MAPKWLRNGVTDNRIHSLRSKGDLQRPERQIESPFASTHPGSQSQHVHLTH